jgi:hypothetical protein
MKPGTVKGGCVLPVKSLTATPPPQGIPACCCITPCCGCLLGFENVCSCCCGRCAHMKVVQQGLVTKQPGSHAILLLPRPSTTCRCPLQAHVQSKRRSKRCSGVHNPPKSQPQQGRNFAGMHQASARLSQVSCPSSTVHDLRPANKMVMRATCSHA